MGPATCNRSGLCCKWRFLGIFGGILADAHVNGRAAASCSHEKVVCFGAAISGCGGSDLPQMAAQI